MKRNLIKTHFLFFVALFFVACNNSKYKLESENSVKDSILNQDVLSKKVTVGNEEMAIGDIPFSFDILDQLYQTHLPFNQELMNAIQNIPKYSRITSKSFNLGIYGSDLAYAITYEQFQLIPNYAKNTKKMAEELNLTFAFDQRVMDKFNEFKDNKDSLSELVFNTFKSIDNNLKTDERLESALLVLTGSWTEAFYISCKSFSKAEKNTSNKQMYKVLAHEKKSLETLLTLLNEVKNSTEIRILSKDLKEIQQDFSISIDDTEISDKQLNSILSKIEKIRNKAIQVN